MKRFLVYGTAESSIDPCPFLFGAPKAIYADLMHVDPVIADEDAGVILFDRPGDARTVFDGNCRLDHTGPNTRWAKACLEGQTGLYIVRRRQRDVVPVTSINKTILLSPNSSPHFGAKCPFFLQDHMSKAFTQDFPLENQATTYLTGSEIAAAIYASIETYSKLKIARNGIDHQ